MIFYCVQNCFLKCPLSYLTEGYYQCSLALVTPPLPPHNPSSAPVVMSHTETPGKHKHSLICSVVGTETFTGNWIGNKPAKCDRLISLLPSICGVECEGPPTWNYLYGTEHLFRIREWMKCSSRGEFSFSSIIELLCYKRDLIMDITE